MSVRRDIVLALVKLRTPLLAYCGRLLASRADLDDALQEIVVTVLRRGVEIEPGFDFRSWTFRVATLTCFAQNRKRRRRVEVDLPEEDVAAVDVQLEREYAYEEILGSPSVVLEALSDEVARACASLTEKERAILLLKCVAGLTCAEIARVLDVPLGTAQGLLTRGRSKMRERLAEAVRRHTKSSSPAGPL